MLFILAVTAPVFADTISTGPRPLYLIDQMKDGVLKDKLLSCSANPVRRTNFSIGHRGAPMQFPEHTIESNKAAARMGAGILECDVTFTADKQLICRHAQNDLHTTTNILATELATKCTTGFSPAS
ncbi:MAG: glycerophosphodiester phosphodiesterase family protein, partial [Roseobacter sp.]